MTVNFSVYIGDTLPSTLHNIIVDYLNILQENKTRRCKITQAQFMKIYCILKGCEVNSHILRAIIDGFGTKERRTLTLEQKVLLAEDFKREDKSNNSDAKFALSKGVNPKTFSKNKNPDSTSANKLSRRRRAVSPTAKDTATWYKVEESLLVCTESCVPGSAVLWDGCGSAVCGDHDNWRISGRVVGLDWNNRSYYSWFISCFTTPRKEDYRVRKASYYCSKMKVVTCTPSSLDSCPENKRQYSPLVDFGEVPVILSSDSELREFMRGGKNKLVYVDFANVDEPKIVLKDTGIVLFLYYFSAYRYLGVADHEKSKLYDSRADGIPSFHGVPRAICVVIRKQYPFSIFFAMVLVLAVVLVCISTLLVLDSTNLEIDRNKVVWTLCISALVGVVVNVHGNDFFGARKLYRESETGKNFMRYWNSPIRKHHSTSLAEYIGRINDMITDLTAVKSLGETSLKAALKQTTQIVCYTPGRFFTYVGPENEEDIPLPCMPLCGPRACASQLQLGPDYRESNTATSRSGHIEISSKPIVDKNTIADVIGSAEWSFQLAIYQVQLLCMNVKKYNYFGDLPHEVLEKIESNRPCRYNPLESFVTVDGFDYSTPYAETWRNDAFKIIDHHLKMLIAKRACCWYALFVSCVSLGIKAILILFLLYLAKVLFWNL